MGVFGSTRLPGIGTKAPTEAVHRGHSVSDAADDAAARGAEPAPAVDMSVDLAGTERPIGLTVRRGWRPTATQARFLELLRQAGGQAVSPVARG